MGFPDDADLGVKVELDLGGTWTDITSSTRLAQAITIKRGRADYASAVDPTQIKLQIRNPDGEFSPQNPVGPHYGLIGRNTPLRVSIAAGSNVRLLLDGSSAGCASTPDDPALHITGDLDVRIEVGANLRTTTTTQVLMGRYGATAGNRSWLLYAQDGVIVFTWFTAAGGSQFVQSTVPPSMPRHAAVRSTLDVDNGAGGYTAALYWAPTLAGPWTPLTSFTGAGTTTVRAGSDSLQIGPGAAGGVLVGDVYAAEVRSGIGGTVVAGPTFTAQPSGTTSFTDSSGRSWSLAGTAEISNRSIRGVGEVPSWPSRWGVGGKLVTANIEASGILRRLRKGDDPLQSTLRRRVPSDPNVLAYWPMEDGSGATQAYSPLPGVRPMSISGMQMAADDSLGGSDALPQWSPPTTLRGYVPPPPIGSLHSDWHVEMVYRLDTLPSTLQTLMQVNVAGASAGAQGPIATVRVMVSTTTVRVGAYDDTGTLLDGHDFTPNNFTDGWGRLQIYTSTSGGTVTLTAEWIVIGAPTNWLTTTAWSGSAGRVASVSGSWGSDFASLRIGHLAVFDMSSTGVFDQADTGFDGDTVDARMTRLAGEEGVPLLTPYGPAGDMFMGPQRPDTLLNLLQAAADADIGILYEPRDAIAVAARPRESLYNQTPALVLDYTQQQIAAPLEPNDDDEQTRNDITVTRSRGSSARVVSIEGALSAQPPPEGAGRYPDTRTLDLYDDTQPEQVAGWLLNLGTYDGVRYAQVTVLLHRSPELIDAAREVDIGDRIQLLNLPVWQPQGPVDLIVQGVTETIGVRTWAMTFNCTPGGPWVVGLLDDDVLGRADTAGSELAADAGAGDTTLSVATTSGPLWTTSAAEFPFDVRLGGEVVTVTAISGTTSPQAFTVTRAVNGVAKPQSAGTDIRLDMPMILAL